MTSVGSLYVHAPFCAHHCFYCDYAVETGEAGMVDAWTESLRLEWGLLRGEGRALCEAPLETLYFGGGTPSLFGARGVEAVAELLDGAGFLGGTDLEWTVEANPEDVTPELLRRWRSSGVTRVSLGIQSFHDGALRWLGRLHDGARAVEALDRTLDAGFRSVSVDLLFGLPPDLGRDWEADLHRVSRSGVPHVTLYDLELELEVRSGLHLPPAPERERAYLSASSFLTEAGYVHYDVTSLAREGHRSRHQEVYGAGRPYLGLGPGAHSFLPPLRRWNLRGWAAYSSTVRRGDLPLEGTEIPDAEARLLEEVWCALRSREGLPWDRIPPGARSLVRRWVDEGWAVTDPETVRLTPRGWLELDRCAVELAEGMSA